MEISEGIENLWKKFEKYNMIGHSQISLCLDSTHFYVTRHNFPFIKFENYHTRDPRHLLEVDMLKFENLAFGYPIKKRKEERQFFEDGYPKKLGYLISEKISSNIEYVNICDIDKEDRNVTKLEFFGYLVIVYRIGNKGENGYGIQWRLYTENDLPEFSEFYKIKYELMEIPKKRRLGQVLTYCESLIRKTKSCRT